jgi:hypothetical protein
MKQLKFLKTVVLALLLLWSTASAQDPQKGEQPVKPAGEIPTLQEWWRTELTPVDGISIENGGISYLPNFKDGRGAIAITTADGDKTWMLRFPGDTANVFTWKQNGARDIKTGDFNGDGVQDYIDIFGYIYPGIQNGQLPSKESVQSPIGYPYFKKIIADFNNDGFDDLIAGSTMGDERKLLMFLGGQDLQKLRLVNKLKKLPLVDYSEALIGVYPAPDKTWRALFYWDNYSLQSKKYGQGGFVLYKLSIVPDADSIRIELSELDRTTLEVSDGKPLCYYDLSKIYKSSHANNAYAIVRSFDFKNQYVFSLNTDKITPYQLALEVGAIIPSIDGDEHEDILAGHMIYSGGETINTTPELRYDGCSMASAGTVGDINGDKINDLIQFYHGKPSFQEKGCLSILLGQTPTGIDESQNSTSFSFEQPTPHPISSHAIVALPVNIINPNTYTVKLYNLQGQSIALLFNSFLDIGKQNIPLNLASYNLSPGSYTLRLSNGRQSRELTIIITQ